MINQLSFVYIRSKNYVNLLINRFIDWMMMIKIYYFIAINLTKLLNWTFIFPITITTTTIILIKIMNYFNHFHYLIAPILTIISHHITFKCHFNFKYHFNFNNIFFLYLFYYSFFIKYFIIINSIIIIIIAVVTIAIIITLSLIIYC